MKNRQKYVICFTVVALSVFGTACKKKVATAAPPQTPQPTTSTPAPAPERQQPTRAESRPESTPAPTPERRTPDAKTKARIEELLAKIEDAYFDYDKHTLRPDAIKALQSDSAELRDILKDYPDYPLTIEGHADERGSAEYNLALGDARAQAAKDYLVQVGIPSNQLHVKSYGKEKPVCEDHNEDCWQKNRRIHIVAGATQ